MREVLFRASRRELLAASTLAAIPAVAKAQPKPKSKVAGATRAQAKGAEAMVRALHAAQPTPALSFAVARPGGVIWTLALGKADLELDVPATTAHCFRLGSVSKMVTTTAAARLVSRGVLDLDAPIVRWLPDLPEPHRRTTLRQLFTHRGGVRHYDLMRDLSPRAPGGPLGQRVYPSNKEILAVFINDPLIGPPGAQIAYSTFGFTLASVVMETAAGRPFVDLLKAEVGEPFGLASLAADDPFALRPGRVSGYCDAATYNAYGLIPTKTGWVNARQDNPAYKWAGGGLTLTPSDLAAFGAALIESPTSAITPAERALLFTPLTPQTKNMPPLGLGWRVDNDPKGRLRWHHAGGDENSRASLVVYPQLGLSIALGSNLYSTPGNVLKPSSDLADVFA